MGDLNIGMKAQYASWGSSSNSVFIDANSTSAGNMTEPRTIDGKDVFMTAEGAAEFDRLQTGNYTAKVNEDPAWYNPLGTKPDQKHEGKL